MNWHGPDGFGFTCPAVSHRRAAGPAPAVRGRCVRGTNGGGRCHTVPVSFGRGNPSGLGKASMRDNCAYCITLRGPVSESEINAAGPLQVKVTRVEPHCTQLTFSSDQSGLVGLVGYLHGLGFIILYIERFEGA